MCLAALANDCASDNDILGEWCHQSLQDAQVSQHGQEMLRHQFAKQQRPILPTTLDHNCESGVIGVIHKVFRTVLGVFNFAALPPFQMILWQQKVRRARARAQTVQFYKPKEASRLLKVFLWQPRKWRQIDRHRGALKL